MRKLQQFIDFIRYVLVAWKKAFSEKPKSGEGGQTTAEEIDAEAWERAKAEYERQMQEDDEEFWKGESKK